MSYRILLLWTLIALASCKGKQLPNQEMIDLLKESARIDHDHDNVFSPEAMVEYCDSVVTASSDEEARNAALKKKANALMQLGQETKGIEILQALLSRTSLGSPDQRAALLKDLANGFLRLGDRMNCINNHTAESCIYPIAGGGIHRDKAG